MQEHRARGAVRGVGKKWAKTSGGKENQPLHELEKRKKKGVKGKGTVKGSTIIWAVECGNGRNQRTHKRGGSMSTKWGGKKRTKERQRKWGELGLENNKVARDNRWANSVEAGKNSVSIRRGGNGEGSHNAGRG